MVPAFYGIPIPRIVLGSFWTLSDQCNQSPFIGKPLNQLLLNVVLSVSDLRTQKDALSHIRSQWCLSCVSSRFLTCCSALLTVIGPLISCIPMMYPILRESWLEVMTTFPVQDNEPSMVFWGGFFFGIETISIFLTYNYLWRMRELAHKHSELK